MKILVITALVVATVGSPLPDSDTKEAQAVQGVSQAVPTGHHQGSVSYVAVPAVQHVAVPVHHYKTTYVSGGGVSPTPEVQQATAAFMSAWNAAAARATKIQSALVKSSPTGAYVVQVPKQVEATDEVKRATAEFMAAWNEAARRAPTVEHAVYSVPQSVQQTTDVKQATAEFMSAWEAAAQQASTIRQAMSTSTIRQAVDHTDEVKRATAEFMAAWEEAAARVPKIESTMYQISGAVPSTAGHHTAGSAPQFSPSVEQATAEFMKAWNAAAAAAAAAPDVNIIMGASSRSSLPSVSHHTPASVSYSLASAPASAAYTGAPQPVQPTPEVQRATAAFMAAWNKAAAQATKIQTNLVRTSYAGQYQVELPKQVEATEEVKRATAEFTAAWNEAARRATTVETAIYRAPQPVQQTADVKQATAEFMSAWEAAAQQASAIRQAISGSSASYSGVPEPVEHTDEVKKATAEFMAAWEEAAARVPKIESTIYQIAGTVASTAPRHTSEAAPQFTPSVEQATAEFMKVWKAAAAAAAAAPDVNIIMGASSRSSQSSVSHHTPASVSYYVSSAPATASYTGAPQPVQPTPEVQRATAAFMAAWNKAAAQATKIQTNLVRTSYAGQYQVELPKQVEATEEVKRATAEFTAAWNEAARRATTVETAIYRAPQPVQQTADVKQATAEFMSAWEAAAQQASAIRQAMSGSSASYSGVPEPVEHTDEVKKATAEFMAAWEEAAARVPKIESTIYQIAGTVASTAPRHTSEAAPQFTPSVEQATAEFMKVWNAAAAAAAAAPDVNIIMGASSRSSQPSVSHHTPASVSYSVSSAPAAAAYTGAPQPVQPTPEVQRATAAFMAAWNNAAAQATKIQTNLVRTSSAGQYQVELPKQVEATEEVKRATAEFTAAWNEAARRATTVETAIYSAPQPVQQTADVRQATAEFMSAWEAAAQQASSIRQAMSATSASQVVDHTEAVKRATAEFMAAWEEAAARVPKIESTIYQISGTVASTAPHYTTGSTPQFAPSVEQATAEFTKAWNAAAAAAAAAPDVNIIMGSRSSHSVSHHSPASVSYSAASSPVSTAYSGIPQPVQPTPEVQQATAAFMAAWNAAAERANKIQSTLIKSSRAGQGLESSQAVEDTSAVEKATAEFMAAWNAAARRGAVVEQAVSSIPQQVEETNEVKRATAEFMAAWHKAAEQASAIRKVIPTVVTYQHAVPQQVHHAVPQQVQATQDVQQATAVFLNAWNEAAARVPKIESTLYVLSSSPAVATSHAPVAVVDTPEVVAAREAFMVKFREAEAAALRTSVNRGVLPAPTVLAVAPAHSVVYSTGAPQQGYTFNGRLFTPVAGLPQHVAVSY